MYDIIAKVELDKEEELKELVSERIRKVDRITGTVTIMIAQGKVEGRRKMRVSKLSHKIYLNHRIFLSKAFYPDLKINNEHQEEEHCRKLQNLIQ